MNIKTFQSPQTLGFSINFKNFRIGAGYVNQTCKPVLHWKKSYYDKTLKKWATWHQLNIIRFKNIAFGIGISIAERIKIKIVDGVLARHGVCEDFNAFLINKNDAEKRLALIKRYESGELSLQKLNTKWR